MCVGGATNRSALSLWHQPVSSSSCKNYHVYDVALIYSHGSIYFSFFLLTASVFCVAAELFPCWNENRTMASICPENSLFEACVYAWSLLGTMLDSCHPGENTPHGAAAALLPELFIRLFYSSRPSLVTGQSVLMFRSGQQGWTNTDPEGFG